MLLTVVKKFNNPDILNYKYEFCNSDVYFLPKYNGPEANNLEIYYQYAATLPSSNDDPEIFGMHDNANITYEAQETNKVIETIVNIQPRDAGGKGQKSTSEIVLELATLFLDPDTGVPPPVPTDREQTHFDFWRTEEDSDILPSLTTVFLQECERFNNLLYSLNSSLKLLVNAINGTELMSQDSDQIFTSMLNNQVPSMWVNKAYPSLKPLSSWMKDLRKRIDFMNEWRHEGTPKQFWMSGMFYPQGFMTGVLQTHSRKEHIPIDRLNFSFKVMEVDIGLPPPPDGVYINGLFLQGAVWDMKKRCIADQMPGDMFDPMP